MWSNFKAEWWTWWRSTSWWERPIVPALVSAHLIMAYGWQRLEVWDLLGATGLLALHYGLPARRAVFQFALPVYLTLLGLKVYPYFPGFFKDFLVTEGERLERHYLSLSWNDQRWTAVDWLRQWGGERWRAASYRFLPWVLPAAWLYSAYLRFGVARVGTQRYSAWGIDMLSPQINWVLLFVALSPQWSVRYFGYAVVSAFYAWKFGSQRMLMTAFLLLVGTVTLRTENYFIVHLLWSSAYALFFIGLQDVFWNRRARRQAGQVWKPSLGKSEPPPRKAANG